MTRDRVIETRGLTKKYGALTAVDGIDLDIQRGEIFGLLGPNGAGKTTALSMLVTIRKPTSGSARVAGLDVMTHPSAVRRKVGIVFQDPSLDSILTARENLELHGRLYGVRGKDLDRRVGDMLRLVDLEKRADDLVKTYSGGMKRRLEIARGLLHDPEILFLDEPTLGLDPQTRRHIWDYVRNLRDTKQTTVVLTTHYMDEADALCDRIAIVDHGRIVALGTPRELKAGLGGDVVILRGASPSAREALAALPTVQRTEETDEGLLVTVEDAARQLGPIVAAAGAVQSIEVRPARLEDVFLAHTGREMRDLPEEGDGFMDAFVRTQQGGAR